MEDEHRPLPPGWIRLFDPTEHHQFFVNTKTDPPRSIWVHPFDDPEYLSTLSPEEREAHAHMHRSMSIDDIAVESSDEGDDHDPDEATHSTHKDARAHRLDPESTAANASNPALPPRPASPPPTGLHKLTRRMKDKLTDSTHAERRLRRAQRADEERRAYAAHLQARQAMARAMETGQPQWLAKDAQGKDVYVLPPGGPGYAPQSSAYGYGPYAAGARGVYADPNARFVRPAGPYGRPYGYGYGGGLGAPIAAGVIGGALLGGLLF